MLTKEYETPEGQIVRVHHSISGITIETDRHSAHVSMSGARFILQELARACGAKVTFDNED